MPDRFTSAYLFGSLGNLTEALGAGWSEEDNFAWAVDEQSTLALPLPGDDSHYLLRFTLHPLTQPGVLDAQRLTITAGETELGSFALNGRQTIDIPLPLHLTRHQSRIALTLTHPDALRPCDFKDTPDSRRLALCFESGALAPQADGTARAPNGAAAAHVVVAGGDLARQIVAVMTALPALQDRLRFHHIRTDSQSATATQTPSVEIVASAALCWEQSGAGDGGDWANLRGALPNGCPRRRFVAPHMTALWPLQGPDPRLVPEPGLPRSGRYPFGDRVGASLANLPLPDDIVLLSYLAMAEKEIVDPDALLASDVDRWRQLDALNDVHVADFILDNFRQQRLFFAPPFATGTLLRHIIDQLAASPLIESACDTDMLRQQLDFLLVGYIGRREELPIHPHVARHFDLTWWHPHMRYRWHGNSWTFEEYALRYIRWVPWRP